MRSPFSIPILHLKAYIVLQILIEAEETDMDIKGYIKNFHCPLKNIEWKQAYEKPIQVYHRQPAAVFIGRAEFGFGFAPFIL